MKDIFKRDSSRADDGRTCRATTQAFMPRRAYIYIVCEQELKMNIDSQ